MATSPTSIVCVERLVASLRDPEVLRGNVTRFIYVTSRPLGNEGATGVMQPGDLTSDPHAKVIHFDREKDAYAVTQNGNPAPPDTYIPDGDIGGVVRHFVRSNSAFGPVFVTVTDMILGRGVETVRKVIPGRQIELVCTHGPDRSARNVPYVRRVTGASDDDGDEGGLSLSTLVIGVMAIGLAYWVYVRFIRAKPAPSESLPDMRPYVVERRHGTRKLRAADDMDARDVRSMFSSMR